MQKIAASLFLLLLAPLTRAAVINVEFKFTPFVGDPATDEKVTTRGGQGGGFQRSRLSSNARQQLDGIISDPPQFARVQSK